MNKIVAITGRLYTGKSGLARLLVSEFGYNHLKTSDLLREHARASQLSTDRMSLQQLGDNLDSETGGQWLMQRVEELLANGDNIVVDSIRTRAQIDLIRRNQRVEVVHVHLYAKQADLMRRYGEQQERAPTGEKYRTYEELDLIKSADDIEAFKRDADVRVNTSRADNADTLVRVAARLGLFSPPNSPSVDVLIGGQFGSEGKGHVAAYLSKEYDVLVRVGGPNAGHSVAGFDENYVYHQLPSGTKDTTAQILLGPGMTINVSSLLKEIEDCGIDESRLFIDPQAMIIDASDKSAESQMVSEIGSTGSGSGAAAARRITSRTASPARLARDVLELERYVGAPPEYRGSTLKQLEIAYRARGNILLEGTQGSGLSLYHGEYPHVTSRDTNVSGCLAEVGIPPSRVRRVLMVVRPTPIRVGNPDGDLGHSSGNIKHEITFTTVAEMSGIPIEELEKNEKTSTTKRKRRVGLFNWEQFRRACLLNAPTDLVLTFADYMTIDNREAHRFEHLDENTIKFVEELERVGQAPVSLINTRFPRDDQERLDLRTIIDRRNWGSPRPRG